MFVRSQMAASESISSASPSRSSSAAPPSRSGGAHHAAAAVPVLTAEACLIEPHVGHCSSRVIISSIAIPRRSRHATLTTSIRDLQVAPDKRRGRDLDVFVGFQSGITLRMMAGRHSVSTTAEAVWSVLADPVLYPRWVLNLVAVSDLDPRWPDPGPPFATHSGGAHSSAPQRRPSLRHMRRITCAFVGAAVLSSSWSPTSRSSRHPLDASS